MASVPIGPDPAVSPFAHWAVLTSATGLWSLADSATFGPVLCAAIAALVPVSERLLQWWREARDKREQRLEQDLEHEIARREKAEAEADRLRLELEGKPRTDA